MTTEVEPTEAEVTAAPEAPKDDVLNAIMGRISKGTGNKKKHLKVMIFGPSGVGKSTLLGQAPKPLIIDVEKGLLPLSAHPELINMNEVFTLEYKSFYQVEELVKRANLNIPELEFFETLGVDSFSELHKRGLAEVVEREFQKNPVIRNRYKAETDDHTENNEHIRQLCSAMRDLERNLIVTAHHRTVQQKDGSIKTYPDFSEKLANTLAGIMDVVGFMEVNEVNGKEVRSLRVRTEGTITCKTRLEALPDVIENPTWDILWDAFQKQLAIDAKKNASA